MIERIQECATRVVSLLAKERVVNVLLFPKLLGEVNFVAYQALGWLARESRIRYSTKARQVYVSLAEGAERRGPDEPGEASCKPSTGSTRG